MTPKKRMTARKRMFADLENEETSRDSHGTNFETEANLENLQHEHVDGSQQFGQPMKNDKASAKKKFLRRSIFFENLEDEGTSGGLQSLHDKDINIQTMDPCHFQDKYAAKSHQSFEDNENIRVESTIGNSFSFGQASYQRSKEGVIVKYQDAGDNEFQCIYCNAHFWLDEANKRRSRK